MTINTMHSLTLTNYNTF